MRESIDSRQPVSYRSFVLSRAPRPSLHDPWESFKPELRIRTAAGIFQCHVYPGHLYACVTICFVIRRLQSNFQIRLRLTFLRIFSKSGWLDCCLELKFPDRSLFKAILNSFPDLFPENCCFLITMLDYLFIFILLWG